MSRIVSSALRWLAATAVVAVGLLQFGSEIPAGASVTVTGTGSSYAAVAINNWVGQVSNVMGLSINYQTSSSVLGLDNFAESQVDFAASEIGYSAGQSSPAHPPFSGYQYLPDVAGATCLMYQLPSATQQPIRNLKLNSSVLMGIFSGAITMWNDAKIQALNPTIGLPGKAITAVYRSDPSGDNYLFSNYLQFMQPSAWSSYTHSANMSNGPTALWPVPPTVPKSFYAAPGSDVASNYVAANPGSITYVETAYAILHGQPCAYLQNARGHNVQPSSTADAIALTHDRLLANLEQNLTGVYTAPEVSAYPISAYSYLVTKTSGMSPAKGATIGKFIQFLACQGQISAGQLGYSPLPPNLVADDFAAIKRIPGAAAPPELNAKNCPNPYLTGAATYYGGPTQTGNGGSSSATNNSGIATPDVPSVHKASTVQAVTATTLDPRSNGQAPGVALNSAVGGLLGVSAPTATIILASLVFVALVAVPPTVGTLRKRRQNVHGGQER
jgi:phosphate transport system substrate-binding protein